MAEPFCLVGKTVVANIHGWLLANRNCPNSTRKRFCGDWGNGEAFRLADAQTGVCVFGATGSGKTSGRPSTLPTATLRPGLGDWSLCAKKEERHQWQQWAAETGREDDLVIIDASGTWRFNFLEWEASRPEEGGGLSLNIVSLLDEIAIAISGHEEGNNSGKFWEDALHHMNTNLVDLPLLAGLEVSLPLLRSIVTSGAYSPEAGERSRMAEDECLRGNSCRGRQSDGEGRRPGTSGF